MATPNNYACSLSPLANVNWFASPECFFSDHDWWNDANGGLQFGSGDLILLPLSAHIFLGLVVDYQCYAGACGHHSHYKLYHCVILLLCFSLFHHPLHPHAPAAHPLIYTGSILINSMKKL